MPSSPFPHLSRRRWLGVSSLGFLSASLPGISRAAEGVASLTPQVAKPIKSCIVVFHYGGPSQFETYDPKPNAPAHIRGEYKLIPTVVPGIQVGEHLPRVAKIMDRLALVRSMHHPMRNHNSAAAEVLTGRTPAGGDQELLADDVRSFPNIGSSVSYGLGSRGNLLPCVALPYTIYNVVQLPGQTPGFLGGGFDRFQVSGNPNHPDFHISSLEPPVGRAAADLALREKLKSSLDQLPAGGKLAKMRSYQERALALISSEKIRQSFDIAKEGAKTRDHYGHHLLGQSLLLARRLVEGGV